MNQRSAGGVGVGWRRDLAAPLLQTPQAVDFVEVLAERCFASADHRREARAIAETWPAVVHGVNLSLATAAGIDADHAVRLGKLARELRAPAVTEHVALTRVPGRDIGHLTAVPFHRELVRVVARNVSAARRRLPDVPFLLENIAWTLRYADDEMSEGAFYAEIAQQTGCGLLLDVGNLYANARNAGLDPFESLADFPLERVEMLHVAGGRLAHGFYFDTHAHAVPELVFELARRVLQARPGIPVVLERDGGFPPWDETAAELARLRAIGDSPAIPVGELRADTRPHIRAALPIREGAAAQQHVLAGVLTGPWRTANAALDRTRAVLDEKRIGDALRLLPALARHGARIDALVRAVIARAPRPPEHVGASDALRVARAALAVPELEPAARRDLLLLRARFVSHAGEDVRPRKGPFVGRDDIAHGALWVFKGPGAAASIRTFHTTRTDRKGTRHAGD